MLNHIFLLLAACLLNVSSYVTHAEPAKSWPALMIFIIISLVGLPPYLAHSLLQPLHSLQSIEPTL